MVREEGERKRFNVSYPLSWSIELDIYVEATSDVAATNPSHSSALGSFDVKAFGMGGGGASDGSTYTSKNYDL